MTLEVELVADPGDGRGLVQMSRADMADLGLAAGNAVRLTGARVTHARAIPGALPPVMWDGIAEEGKGLRIAPGVTGWTLGLSRPGQSLAEAQPGPLMLTPVADWDFPEVGAPAALEARLQ